MELWVYRIRLSLLFLYWSIPIFVLAGAKTDIEGISNFINQYPIIRVIVTSAPNNGHQSASISVIQRLRELDYKGLIEVLYDTDGTGFKISNMLPVFLGPSDGKNQYYPLENLRFINGGGIFFPDTDDLDQVPLAISGACDYSFDLSRIKADSLLDLEPMNWPVVPQLRFLKSNSHKDRKLVKLKKFGIILDPPDPKDTDLFLQKYLIGNTYNEKLPFLSKLLNSSHSREILPVYGHGISVTAKPYRYDLKRGVYQLGNLLLALAAGAEEVPKAFSNGIIIPLVNDLTERDFEFINSDIEKIKSSYSIPIDFYKFGDPNLLSTIDRKNDKRIVVVFLGPIPKKVFELLFNRETLPGIVEGLNSIHYMSVLGKPYLPSTKHEGFHFHNGLVINSFLSKFYGIGKKIYSASLDLINNEDLTLKNSLMNFYLSAYTDREKLWSYFLKYKIDESNRNLSDQLYLGLREYKREMEKNNHWILNYLKWKGNSEMISDAVKCESLFDF